VVAITLFAFIVIEVLADRETSIEMSANARVIQTVRYLALAKIDEIRHDPEQFGESDNGNFLDLDPDEARYEAYTWELEIKRVVAVGGSEDTSEDYLFEDDEDNDPVAGPDGNPIDPRYVRKLTLTVRYEPQGEPRPELSIKIVTFIPPDPEEEEQQ
jgi:hypothetical protein